ncbi:MAG: biotin--[acetyl-CoA-carboxylase] ligase [Acidobacteria bacterium]|nr:biotin--[acetyl-CoA-carboxylase] ligase [Acidobacteriota bacterium]
MNYDGLDPAALAKRLAVPSCLALEKVTSTLDLIHQLAEEGAPAGVLVLADEQVSGRGRQGRRWHSPKGSGIWLATLKRPPRPVDGGLLALRVGLCVANALDSLGIASNIKWPNDVMIHDRKVAGILCEARSGSMGTWVAVGIGINVYGPLPSDIADVAISLDDIHSTVTRLAVLDALVPLLGVLCDAPTLTRAECIEFRERDWLGGRSIIEPVEGKARGIDQDGALLIQTSDGTVERIVGGQVVSS